MKNELRIVLVEECCRHVFDRLLQCYEAEFSGITGKLPDQEGVFELDTHLDESHRGFLAYLGDFPVGFNVIALKGNERFEVCEFYIVPAVRKRGYGYQLAAALFDSYRGFWEVKQISGADQAKAFWCRVIGCYTNDSYEEDIFSDPYWGSVTRQTFCNCE